MFDCKKVLLQKCINSRLSETSAFNCFFSSISLLSVHFLRTNKREHRLLKALKRAYNQILSRIHVCFDLRDILFHKSRVHSTASPQFSSSASTFFARISESIISLRPFNELTIRYFQGYMSVFSTASIYGKFFPQIEIQPPLSSHE